MENELYFTYTCPVSRKTYAGHPRDGHLYTHDNDLEEAINIIHRVARKHSQPVTWVINDQEYTDQEGLLHYFKRFQAEGDAILVTMELTTSPPEVDKFDTKAVLSWIDDRCREAGLRIDGLWSLRFLESDLRAMLEMDPHKFAWTRNLAGSCWHQIGIDDSTWGGCPYNPYYASVANVRAPAAPGEGHDFLMLEWLSRDIPAILAGGFPATFSLDPADSNRKDAGGFDNEPDALHYSEALIMELARQAQLNPAVVINVNEEARHFQTEGHDKEFMLDGMFGCASRVENIRRVTYAQLYSRLRDVLYPGSERLFVCKSVDWRAPEDVGVVYQDSECQMGFLRSRGALPVEVFDYSARHPGGDSNEAYPAAGIDGVRVVSQKVKRSGDTVDVELVVTLDRADVEKRVVGFAVWDAGVDPNYEIIDRCDSVISARAGLESCIIIKAAVVGGENRLRLRTAARR